MKRFKWILATAALMVGLSGAMFAQEQGRNGVRDDNGRSVYSQRQGDEREGAWNNGYRSDDNYRADRDRAYRDRDLDRDAYRTRNREHRDRDHQRRDRDDRDRDRR